MRSTKKISRIAGAGYLMIFISGIFANFFVLEGILVPDDAAATFSNLLADQSLFRAGILGFLVMVAFDALLAWALHLLFRRVDHDLSLLAAWLRLANAVLFAVALVNLPAVFPLLSGPGSAPDKVMLLLDHFNQAWLIGLVFFGLHLGVLGFLALRSGFVPRILGILLLVAGGGYLLDSFAQLLMPSYRDFEDLFALVVVVPGIIGELALTVWLLVKGVPEQEG